MSNFSHIAIIDQAQPYRAYITAYPTFGDHKPMAVGWGKVVHFDQMHNTVDVVALRGGWKVSGARVATTDWIYSIPYEEDLTMPQSDTVYQQLQNLYPTTERFVIYQDIGSGNDITFALVDSQNIGCERTYKAHDSEGVYLIEYTPMHQGGHDLSDERHRHVSQRWAQHLGQLILKQWLAAGHSITRTAESTTVPMVVSHPTVIADDNFPKSVGEMQNLINSTDLANTLNVTGTATLNGSTVHVADLTGFLNSVNGDSLRVTETGIIVGKAGVMDSPPPTVPDMLAAHQLPTWQEVIDFVQSDSNIRAACDDFGSAFADIGTGSKYLRLAMQQYQYSLLAARWEGVRQVYSQAAVAWDSERLRAQCMAYSAKAAYLAQASQLAANMVGRYLQAESHIGAKVV